MSQQRVADQLVEMLIEAGVKRIYGITGDSLNPVNDAVRRSGKLQWIHVRHEEAAAYAASMDAELNGIGCCMGSSGPGHVHLVNGLYDANAAGNPVIAIASTCRSFQFGRQYHQETHVPKLFADCAKYVEVATTPAQFPSMMEQALQIAVNARGVSVIGLPGDVASLPAAPRTSRAIRRAPRSVYRPDDQELDALAAILNQHQRVTVYCGYGARKAVGEVLQVAQLLKAPVAYSYRAKIFFDVSTNPYRVGLNGLLGHRSGFDAVNQAEVLLLLGTDFPYTDFLPKDSLIVQIDDKPEHLGRRAHLTMGLAGDVGDTLRALLPRLVEHTNSTFLSAMQQAYAQNVANFQRFVHTQGEIDHIHPEYVAHLIDKHADRDAVITVDTGMCSVWAARFISGDESRYLTGSFNHGSMANAMPMAIGAAASTSRQVIAMCGDGGLSMLMGDLATIMQYRLPIKMIVFNNRALGMVKLEMEVAGLLDWQTDMVNPPFEQMAACMGMHAQLVQSPDALEDAIVKAFQTPGPALINVMTSPEALSMPPHPTLKEMRGFLTSMMKKVLAGQKDEVLQTVKVNLGHLHEVI